MASFTGIELKPDSCVLAGCRPSRAGVDVFALHAVAPADWPGQDLTIAEMLRSVRTRKRFPRRARVVVWGLPDHATASDPATLALLRPFTSAGFKIQSVVSPPQALAAIAARRPRVDIGGAVAWLALNMHGAAIAVVAGTELAYARTFDWLYTPGDPGSTAQLLQRYTLVAHLAPELRHAMTEVRASHGVRVDAAVNCGDLPDLRSLTMPLIEELDLEVETLDSTDGLRAIGRARLEKFAELAPAMRLACATRDTAPTRADRGRTPRPWIQAAAAAAFILAAVGYVYWSSFGTEPPQTPAQSSSPAQQTRGQKPATTAVPQSAGGRTTQTSPAADGARRGAGPAARTAQLPPSPAHTGDIPSAGRLPDATAPPVPARPGAEQQTRASADKHMTSSAPPPGTPRTEPAPAPPAPATPKPPAKTAAPEVGEAPPSFAPRVVAPERPRVAASKPPAPPQPLKEPLPRVDSILVDRDRRLAIIEAAIVSVGDTIGSRTIVQIDRDTVVLREPSGLEVRVRLRSFRGEEK